jgi:tetratricopeptide (TPR) repeat protein
MDVKLVSNLALAAALVSAAIAVPVVAKEKPAAAAAAPLQDLSKEFRVAAQGVQKSLQAKDYAAANTALPAAEAAATKPADKYFVGLFRYQIGAGLKDDKSQTVGVQAMLDSGVAPAEQAGPLNLHIGREAYFAKDYTKALTYLAEAIRLGKAAPETYILAADVSFKQKQFPTGLAYAEQAIAAQKATGQPVAEDWYNRGLGAAYNAKLPAETVKWSSMLVRAYPTATNWRSALVLYRDSKALDPQITLDIYRLMRATKSIAGERDYYDYAAIASERGLPGETKAVVDLAVVSDAKLATSKNLAELRSAATPKIAADLASLPASEKAANTAPTGKAAMNTADAYLSYGQDAKAIPLYRLALQKGGIDVDAANTRLGIALARTGDKEGARAAFATVKGVRAESAGLWTIFLDVAPAS